MKSNNVIEESTKLKANKYIEQHKHQDLREIEEGEEHEDEALEQQV
jgi:hypothetical protein